jgi:arylsulfatase A-like enzyme
MTDSAKNGTSRRVVLARVGGLGAGLALAGCRAPGLDDPETPPDSQRDITLPDRPNVIVVYADDMGWLDAAFQGSEYYETPNLDALAEGGLTFSAGYANAPNCAPSRACLLTGQYTPRHQVYTVNDPTKVAPKRRRLDPPPNNRTLPPENTTIGEVLSAAGYATGFVGKWHVGEADSETGPLARGFGMNVGGGIYGRTPSGYFPPYNLPNLSDSGDQYLTDRLTDHAVEFIETRTDGSEPFFLLYSPYSVHEPLQAPDSDIEPYRNKDCWNGQCNPKYGGMVSALDRTVGRLVDTLEEVGITEETLVFFSSDNGGVGDYGEVGITGNWQQYTSQGPLRGGKGTLYEGGIRVPTVLSWPGVVPGDRVRTPILASDLFPTLVELAGAGDAVPDDHTVDGRSLVPLIERSEPTDRGALFWHFPSYLTGKNLDVFRTRPVSVVRQGRWKLHHYYAGDRTKLYDLRTDRGETENLAQRRPEKRDELLARLERWKDNVGAREPTPRDRSQ